MGQNVEDNRLWGGWAPTDAATIKLLYLRQREHDRRGKIVRAKRSESLLQDHVSTNGTSNCLRKPK